MDGLIGGGWMDKWMSGWMDEWMDGQKGWLDCRMEG
jgi:hypothetical protein